MSRNIHSFSAVVAALAAAAGLCVTPVASAASAVTWYPCDSRVAVPGSKCGHITVPLNWDAPHDKRTIQVGFVVRPATGKKLGSLFVNPGGPGGDAFAYAAGKQKFTFGYNPVVPNVIAKHFDIIGVQPRGLVDSTPLECLPLKEKDFEKSPLAQQALPKTPGTGFAAAAGAPSVGPQPNLDSPAALLAGLVNPGTLRRALCNSEKPGLAESLTTANTVKDWEAVREALGLQRISILGLSYGTWLGSAYATAYPEHVDRLVLDSAVNPKLIWNQVFASQEQPYIRQFHAFLAWVAAHDNVYHLGTTPFAVYQRWAQKIHDESGVYPSSQPPALQPADTARLIPGVNPALINAVAPAAADTNSAVSSLLVGLKSRPSPLFTITRAFIPQLQDWHFLADYLSGRVSQDQVLADIGSTPKQRFNSIKQVITAQFMQEAIICNENLSPQQPAAFVSSLFYSILAPDVFRIPRALTSGHNCAGVPVSDPHPPVNIDGSKLRVQPLLIQGLDDPQTPYQLALPVRDAMRAHLVTVHDGNHGHVGTGNKAVDQLVANYLVTGHTTVTDAPGYVPVAQ